MNSKNIIAIILLSFVSIFYSQTANAQISEKAVIEKKHHQLSGEEIKEKLIGKTIWGDYYNGRKYISYCAADGIMEGENDFGAHHKGNWIINYKKNTFTVIWDYGWDNWTGRAYDVNGEIVFFDSTTSKWVTTFKVFKDGKQKIEY